MKTLHSPSVLDITGRAELRTKIDTQFPMICQEKSEKHWAVTQEDEK